MLPFSAITSTWFRAAFTTETEVQRRGWEAIARGEHALLVAPTGSGKTLAAFLWAIDRLSSTSAQTDQGALRVLYVSPLKALAADVERNLRAPLSGIAREAQRNGANVALPRVSVRTGDTSAKERRQQARTPTEILVTTPESLYLLLGSRARANLRSVETVIIDEVHALAGTKRGAHLALSLERLSALCGRDPQRVGLSATAEPIGEVARFLGGDRAVSVVDASEPPRIDLAISVPVLDMSRPDAAPSSDDARSSATSTAGVPASERGLWPAIVPKLLELVRAHRATILFVNSRSLCERLCRRINDLAGQELLRAHHGSLAHAERTVIEEQLKRGEIAGIVATSSLELGIDMGAVDLVLLVESPGSVARGLQRIGRAGHGVGEVSKGRLFPKHRGDLLEATVVAQRMRDGAIEALSIPDNPLDVLAQHVVAMVAERDWSVAQVAALARRSVNFRALPGDALHAVLDMLSGRYPSHAFADLRPRITWDRDRDRLSTRRGAALIAIVNGGTIPDRGMYAVHLGEDGPRVGELDEEMVHESMPGEVFALGASSWRLERIAQDRVIVSPAPGEAGKLPFWRGDGPGRPVELGRALGAFVREIAALPEAAAVERLTRDEQLDAFAAHNVLSYLREQREATGALPTDRAITIECFRDELGDHRVCILSPLGARVHAPWALAIEATLSAQGCPFAQTTHNDDGIVLRFADGETAPELTLLVPDPEDVHDLIMQRLAGSALFAGLFRENAARALLLPRRRPDARVPLFLQRRRAAELLAVAREYPSFPIVLETYRSCLKDVFDVPSLIGLLSAIKRREVRVDVAHTSTASPFARNLVFAYVASNLYEGDAPLAEHRAHALALDRKLLRELLGETALRELLDPEVMAALHAELQGRAKSDARATPIRCTTCCAASATCVPTRSRRAATATPRGFSPSSKSTSARCAWTSAASSAWSRSRTSRCIGTRSAPPRLRMCRSCSSSRRSIRSRRWSHAMRARVGPSRCPSSPCATRCQKRRSRRGSNRCSRAARWCATTCARADMSRTCATPRCCGASNAARSGACAMRRRPSITACSRAFCRRGTASARPAPASPNCKTRSSSSKACRWPFSDLERSILPGRVRDFTPAMLDQLGASGFLVWVGRGALGATDGRVALYRRERLAALLALEPATEPLEPLAQRIVDHLSRRGACFFSELQQAGSPASSDDVLRALSALIWAGLATNDTFAPLRSSGTIKTKSPRAHGRALARKSGGRWSLVSELLRTPTTETERAYARATKLLERHGIVTREVAQLEDAPGGFSATYAVLRAMEESGKIRRGYFIDGLGGAQFAYAGAVERLRALQTERPPTTLVLCATDPANPFGWLVPWPGDAQQGQAAQVSRPRRVAGASVVLVRGEPVLYLGNGGKHLLTFAAARDPESLDLAVTAMRELARTRRGKALRIEQIDGDNARSSIWAPSLLALGFTASYRGIDLEAE